LIPLDPAWLSLSLLLLTRRVARQVAGESGLGKTTFINTLFSTTIKNYADHKRRHQKQIDKTVEIEITKAELEEKFFKGACCRRLLCVFYPSAKSAN